MQSVARYYHYETVQIDGKDDDTCQSVRKGFIKKCHRIEFRQKYFTESGLSASKSLERAVADRAQSSSRSGKRSSSSTQMKPPPATRSCSSIRSRDSETPSHNRIHRHVITRNTGKIIQEKLANRLQGMHLYWTLEFCTAISRLEISWSLSKRTEAFSSTSISQSR